MTARTVTAARARAALMIALGGYVALSAAVTAVRWDYLLRVGDLFKDTGSEGPAVYTVWKARRGYPLYERPDRDNFSPTLYNFLFYESYGALLRAADVSDTRLLTASRFITAAFAVAGVAVTWLLVRRAIGGPPPAGWLLAAYIAAVWLGPGTTVWWAVTARPDVPAVVLALAGVLALARALDAGGVKAPAWAVVASALFFCDWAFKQSCVWTLAGAGLYLMLSRRWAILFGLAAPFGAAAAVSLWLGGPVYRQNIFGLPAISPFRPADLPPKLAEVLVPNLFLYGFAVVAVVRIFRRREPSPLCRLLSCALATSTAFGLVTLSRDGSSRNMLFESMMLAAVLATTELAALLSAGTDGPRWAAAVLVTTMWSVPAVNLAIPHLRAGPVRSNLTYGDAAAYARRRAFADWLAGRPKPVFFPDEILSQPWFTTGGHYPAFVLDAWLYSHMEMAGVLEGGGLVGKIRRLEFGTVIDWEGGPFAAAAAEAGYREVVPPPGLEVLPGESLGESRVSVWQRPPTGEPARAGGPVAPSQTSLP